MRSPDRYLIHGTGPVGSVCLLMVACGLGDDMCALPGIAELAKTHAVTVYTRTFHKPIFAALPVNIVCVDSDGKCDNGEYLGPWWDHDQLNKYELIYKLENWGGWEDDSLGYSRRGRIEQFAGIVGATVGVDPDFFRSTLRPVSASGFGYTLLAVESVESWRSLPDEQARLLHDELSLESAVIWLTNGDEKRDSAWMHKAADWNELLNLVANAERVIAVDNGIAHMSAALGKPLTVLGGMTNVRDIFRQYEAFNPGWTFETVQSGHNECSAPCYRQPKQGFINRLCCGSYASPQCMESVTTGTVLSVAYSAKATHQNAILTQ